MVRFIFLECSLLLIILCGLTTDSAAQRDGTDSLLQLLHQEAGPNGKPAFTNAAFKGTRIINGHSIENVAKGVLDFRVAHRFGALDQGISNFLGLDNAVTKIGFDYGLTDRLAIGVGRSTYQKEFDGFLKVKILRQREDDKIPLSLSYVGAAYIQSLRMPPIGEEAFPLAYRMSYMNQLLIARKFSRNFTLQLMPTHVHYNFVPYADDPNDLLALGFGGRLKFSKRMAITWEYFLTLPGNRMRDAINAVAIGLDIETGGHVFQLFFSNAPAINEGVVIGKTTDDWRKGMIHFGFNISRVFTIVRPKMGS